MADPLVPEYEALLGTVAGFRPRARGERKLCLFWPNRGEAYEGGLMIVGRAVNGWGSDPWTPPVNPDSEWRSARITNARACGAFEGMIDAAGKLTPLWGDDGKYRSSRSAFWRVAGRVTAKVLGGGRGLQQIVWSNLYKVAPHRVAPHEGGNPGSPLRRTQEKDALAILQAEIAHFQPRRILFLTALDWAGGFLGRSYDPKGRWDRNEPVQWSGSLAFEGLKDPPVAVVAPHPQGFPGGEEHLAGAIIQALRT